MANIKPNRTQEQIDEQNESFMCLVIELNKDMHDNCDMNDCKACIGE